MLRVGDDSRSINTTGRYRSTSDTPLAPNRVSAVVVSMVAMMVWQADEAGRRGAGVVEQRTKGGL